VFSAAYGAGTIAWMPVKPDGTLGVAQQMAVGDKAHAVNFDATGAFVFVPCLGVDYVAQLTFDAASGALQWNSVAPTAALPNASGPRHLVFHPTLPSLAFVLCELTSVVVPFALNSSTGVLTQVGAPLSTIRAGLPLPTVQAAAEILATADGRYLYATNRASPLGRGDNSIAVIPLSPQGAMNGGVVQWATGEGVGALSFPRHAVLTSAPAQPFLLAVSQNSGVITVFERDQASGLLFQTAAKSAENQQPIFVGELLV
jgi:6-phosphogluconolactonase